jgi:hypothetical protein
VTSYQFKKIEKIKQLSFICGAKDFWRSARSVRHLEPIWNLISDASLFSRVFVHEEAQ